MLGMQLNVWVCCVLVHKHASIGFHCRPIGSIGSKLTRGVLRLLSLQTKKTPTLGGWRWISLVWMTFGLGREVGVGWARVPLWMSWKLELNVLRNVWVTTRGVELGLGSFLLLLAPLS